MRRFIALMIMLSFCSNPSNAMLVMTHGNDKIHRGTERNWSMQTLAEQTQADARDDRIKLQYLSMVYNEEVSDLSLFTEIEMVYMYSQPRLPMTLLPGEHRNAFAEKCREDSTLSGEYHMQRFGFIAPAGYLWQNADWYESSSYESRHPSAPGGFPDFTWIEVTRNFLGYTEGSHGGCWFHVRKGTGVFVNTRKTLVISSDDRRVTRAAGLGDEQGEGCWDWCSQARQHGYDSVQILKMTLDGGSSEFIYCSERCADTLVTTACVPDLELRTGLSADKACNCDPNIGVLNCGNEIAPKGIGCLHESGQIPCQKGLLNPCDFDEQDTLLPFEGQTGQRPRDVQMALDIQRLVIDLGMLQLMEGGMALPGAALSGYDWKRILADQWTTPLLEQGLQIVDDDDAREPAVSLIDSKGKELKDMSFEMIAANDISFPITLRFSIFLKHFQTFASIRDLPNVTDAEKQNTTKQNANPIGDKQNSQREVLGSIASVYCFS